MKPHEHRQETEAVRAGTDLHKKNAPLATPAANTRLESIFCCAGVNASFNVLISTICCTAESAIP